MNRRNVILGGAAAGFTAVAGIRLTGVLSNGSDPSPPENQVEIRTIGMINESSESHTLSLTVRFNGDTIHDEAHSLGTSGAAQRFAIQNLPEEPGRYEVVATLDDGQQADLEPPEYSGYECLKTATLIIDTDNRLSPFLIGACNDTSDTS